MSSLNQLYVHLVWSTKHRQDLIHNDIEKDVYEFMKDEFRENGSPCLIINGTPNHVHCLVKLNLTVALATVVKNVKGSTSHYINQNGIIHERFSWQKGYAAFSVSASGIDRVLRYIANQKKHHNTQSLEEELEEFENLEERLYKKT